VRQWKVRTAWAKILKGCRAVGKLKFFLLVSVVIGQIGFALSFRFVIREFSVKGDPWALLLTVSLLLAGN